MRLLLRGRVGHDKEGIADLNYVMGNEPIGSFVADVDAAVQSAEPVTDFGTQRSTPSASPSQSVATVEPRRGWMEAMADQAVRAEFEGIKLKGSSIHFKMTKTSGCQRSCHRRSWWNTATHNSDANGRWIGRHTRRRHRYRCDGEEEDQQYLPDG